MAVVRPIPHKLRSTIDPTPHGDPNLMGEKVNMWIDPRGVLRRRPGVRHKQTVTQTNTLDDLCGLFRTSGDNYILAGIGNASTELWTHTFTYSGASGFNTPTQSSTGNIRVLSGISPWQTRFMYGSNVNEFLVVHPDTRDILIHNNSTLVDTAHRPASLNSGESIVSGTYVDGYLILSLVNTGTSTYLNKAIFSDITNFTSWPASNFIEASYQGDKIYNLASGAGEFYIYNSNSIETWQNDGQNPFSRRTGGALPYGSLQFAAEPARLENILYHIDSEGRILAFNGVETRQIAPQASLYLQEYTFNSFLGRHNMNGFFFEGKPYLHIMNAQESIIIDLSTEDFSVFSGDSNWESDIRNVEGWDRRVIQTADMGNGFVTIGDTYLRGYEYGYYQDTQLGTDTTQDMFAGIRTGWISHDSQSTKRSEELIVTCYRDPDETVPEVKVRFRDDGDTTWSDERTLELSQFSGGMNVFKLFKNGMYKHRQWSIYTTSNADFKLGEIREKITELGR